MHSIEQAIARAARESAGADTSVACRHFVAVLIGSLEALEDMGGPARGADGSLQEALEALYVMMPHMAPKDGKGQP